MHRCVSKEYIWMADKHMKWHSMSICHQGNANQNHFGSTSSAPIKKRDNNNCWQACEKLEPSYTTGGNVNGAVALQESDSSSKYYTQLPYDPAAPFQGIYSREVKTYVRIQNYTWMLEQHYSYSWRVETTQMSTDWWMNVYNLLYPYSGILFGHKREWSSDARYNVDECWKPDVKWKKSDIYMKCPE